MSLSLLPNTGGVHLLHSVHKVHFAHTVHIVHFCPPCLKKRRFRQNGNRFKQSAGLGGETRLPPLYSRGTAIQLEGDITC